MYSSDPLFSTSAFPPYSPSISASLLNNQAGVGIYFQEEKDRPGVVLVNHLIRGAAADRSGQIQPGDQIISINGIDVTGKHVAELRDLIVGPVNSPVNLTFRRVNASGQSIIFSTELARGTPDQFGTNTSPAPVPQLPTHLPAPPPVNSEEYFLREKLKALQMQLSDSEQKRQNAEAALNAMQRDVMNDQARRGSEEMMRRRLEDERLGWEEALRKEIQKRRIEEKRRQDAEQREAAAREDLQRRMNVPPPPSGPSPEQLRVMEEEANRLRSRLQEVEGKLASEEQRRRETEVRERKLVEELKRRMQLEADAGPGTVKEVDQDMAMREIARLDVIALPHVVAHLQGLLANQEQFRVNTAATAIMATALEDLGRRSLAGIPQAVPQMTSLLDSPRVSTAREASFAIALTAIEPEGRRMILTVQNVIPKLEELLLSEDTQIVRYSTLALGNMAMDMPGRAAILAIPSAIEHLSMLLGSSDVETVRNSCLALGNLAMEEQGRVHLIRTQDAIAKLTKLLASGDRQTARFACGAVRNVAVEPSGRNAIIQYHPAAITLLEEMTSSKDVPTARFAASALKNIRVSSTNSGTY